MRTLRLITCDNVTEAYLIKGRLENEGIHCFLTNQNLTSLAPMYNNMLGAGIQIMIQENNLEKAQQIIKDKIAPDNKQTVCPYCGSANIKLGIGNRKALKIFNMLISILFVIPIGNLKPKFYCKECKKEIR